jgi:cytochrome c oxidase subunit 3
MSHAPASEKYYVPHESKWPIIGSAAFFTMLLGVIALLNDWAPAWAIVPGFALVVYMFIGWFGTVIGENQQGVYGIDVDRSFRMGMMWFIFSEVMFFAAFFGALFYARSLSVPWLGGEGTKVMGNELLHVAVRKLLAHQRPRRSSARATTAASRSSRPSACRRSTPSSCCCRASP